AGKAYISEFVRTMKPGGLLIFQVPSTPRTAPAQPAMPAIPDQPAPVAKRSGTLDRIKSLYSALRAKLDGVDKNTNPEQLIDMYGIPRGQVIEVIEKTEGRVL